MTFLKATLLATTDVADQKRTVVHFMYGGAYAGGLPDEVAATITGEPWVEDWRVMNLPGRMETHRALISDYKNYAARFDAVADYLKQQRPPALMLWGAARCLLRYRRNAELDAGSSANGSAYLMAGTFFLKRTQNRPSPS